MKEKTDIKQLLKDKKKRRVAIALIVFFVLFLSFLGLGGGM